MMLDVTTIVYDDAWTDTVLFRLLRAKVNSAATSLEPRKSKGKGKKLCTVRLKTEFQRPLLAHASN